MTNQQFPDLIKSGLKVGDKVYSYQYGDGVVIEILTNTSFPIEIRFKHGDESFTAYGMYEKSQFIPSITMQPWNPVLGEPFPYPKFEPKEGKAYAFWDNKDTWSNEIKRFCVSVFNRKEGFRFIDANDMPWDNCAPIEEAMRIFRITESE